MRSAAVLLLLLCVRAAGQEERARGLAEASVEEVKRDPELGVLLAREALAAADVEPARTALYAALIRTCKCTVLEGHEGAVSCCDIAPDGKLLATGSEDGTARLWDPEGRQVASLAAGAAVREVRFVGFERVVVATGAALTLWDRAGGKLAEFPASPHFLTAGGLLLLPEGMVRFVGGDGKVLRELAAIRGGVGGGDIAFHAFTPDGKLRWYDRTGREKAVKPAAGTSSAVFADSGTLVATFGSGNAVELWSKEGKKLGELAHGGPVEQVAVSATGDRILSAAADGQYSYWTGAGKLTRRVPKPGPARFVALPPACGIGIGLAGDGHVMLSYPTLDSGDEVVRKHVGSRTRRIEPNWTGHAIKVEDEDGLNRFVFWTTLNDVKVQNHLRGELTASRWGNRSDWQLVGDEKGVAALHHWGRVRDLKLRGHTGAILDAAFSADDRLVLTASRDRTARLWQLESPEMPLLQHPRNGVSGVAFSQTDTLVTFDWDGAHLWRRDGGHIRSFALRDNLSGWAVGEGVAISVMGDTAATLLDTVTGKEIAQLKHDGVISSITRSWPKYDRYATYSFADHTARLWDTAGKRRAVLKHPCGVVVAGFNTDGSLMTLAEDNRARIWSSGGSLVDEFQLPRDVASCLTSPKGDRFVSSHDGGRTLRLWTMKGKDLGTLAGHKAVARGWSFSWDGEEILTTSDDRTARLWDKDGKRGRVIEHPAEVWMGFFLPEQEGFVTGCKDGMVRHFDRDGNLRALLDGHAEYLVNSGDCTDDGRFLATGSDDRTARVWPLRRDDLLRIAKEKVPRDFTPAERERFAALLTE